MLSRIEYNIQRERKEKRTCDGHSEGTGLLVGGKGDIVEEKGNDTIDQEGKDQLP